MDDERPPEKPVRVISASSGTLLAHLNPLGLARGLWPFRDLIRQMAARRVTQRYKGSYLGLVWCVIQPLAMILVYTFVFAVIFKARWYRGFGETPLEYAVVVFTGLIPFQLFSETMAAAPALIPSHRAYVKKASFPMETLPVAVVGSLCVDAAVRCAVLAVVSAFLAGGVSWTIALLPLLFIPLVLLALGLAWGIATLGVFVRDVAHVLEIAVSMLFFLTPILYPLTAVPERFRPFLLINPLCFVVSYFRDVILWSQTPSPAEFLGLTLGSLAVCVAGYAFFMKAKPAFVDAV